MIISHKNTISKEQIEMVKNSMTLSRYKNAMKDCIRLYQ